MSKVDTICSKPLSQPTITGMAIGWYDFCKSSKKGFTTVPIFLKKKGYAQLSNRPQVRYITIFALRRHSDLRLAITLIPISCSFFMMRTPITAHLPFAILMFALFTAGCGGNASQTQALKAPVAANDSAFYVPDDEFLTDGRIFSEDSLPQQNFTIDTRKDEALTSRSGAILYFPQGCFVNDSGVALSGRVQVRVREVREAGDLVQSGITSTCKHHLLSLNGLYRIYASHNGAPLNIDSTKGVYVSLPVADDSTITTQLFHGARKQPVGTVEWRETRYHAEKDTLRKALGQPLQLAEGFFADTLMPVDPARFDDRHNRMDLQYFYCQEFLKWATKAHGEAGRTTFTTRLGMSHHKFSDAEWRNLCTGYDNLYWVGDTLMGPDHFYNTFMSPNKLNITKGKPVLRLEHGHLLTNIYDWTEMHKRLARFVLEYNARRAGLDLAALTKLTRIERRYDAKTSVRRLRARLAQEGWYACGRLRKESPQFYRGEVKENETDKPADAVEVHLISHDARYHLVHLTNAKGQYEFAFLPDSRFYILAVKPDEQHADKAHYALTEVRPNQTEPSAIRLEPIGVEQLTRVLANLNRPRRAG